MSASAAPQQQQSADDDATLKRNTDCVYFLASPLTCKKGSECEYRHSEYARMNPRDCYFWLNSKCLNPKCTFRHPPLDGIGGTQAVAPSGSSSSPSVPPSQPMSTPVINGPFTGKMGVPCVYFQKGFCSRGDRCTFLHGPCLKSHKGTHPQGPAAMPSAGLPSLKKPSAGQEKCTQENKISQEYMSKSVEANPKPSPFVVSAPSRNVSGTGKIVNDGKMITRPVNQDSEHHGKTSSRIAHVSNGNSAYRTSHVSQIYIPDGHSSKYADDFLRESSPGFDVLVDNEREDHEYYNSEDQYERPRGHETEYNSGYSADRRSIPDAGQDKARNPHHLDSRLMQQRHALGEYMATSDRPFSGSSDRDKRKYPSSKSPDHVYKSDLRHQLSKKRRADGSKSLVSYDDVYDNHGDEQHYQSSSRRSSELALPHESSLSSRLHGRINLLGRASPGQGSNMLPNRDAERGRNWRSSEAGGSRISSYHGSVHDRIKDKVQDYDSYMERSLRVPRKSTEEVMGGRNADFSGPRDLAEVKGRGQRIKEDQQSECDLSFEGPKPLSEILKRKRGAEAADSGKNKISETKSMNSLEGRKNTVAKQSGLPSTSKEEASNQISNNLEDLKSQPSDLIEPEEDTSQALDRSEIRTEDDVIVDEAAEDYEYDADGQEEGEYEYEYGDEGEYNYDEAEIAEGEEEYVEDEDGDDFAKKIGVMS